jgi:nitrite reductase (NADH) large subunit
VCICARGSRNIVIVGNGMASARLCEKLAVAGATRERRVIVLGEERVPAYDRVRLTDLLERERAGDRVALAPASWYEDHGIELHLGDPAVALERGSRTVITRGGRSVGYDALVLATGSRAHLPPIPGLAQAGVYAYRTLDDALALRDRALRGGPAVVLGGGLLGLEAARALVGLGLAVTLVEQSDRLMPRQLDEPAARALLALVGPSGVAVRTSAAVQAIEPGLVVRLDSGEALPAELVVVATGVRPRDELARQAGLPVATGGGVIVDDGLGTSDPHVFAVGECASHRGTTYGLVQPTFQMVDVLCRRLLGENPRFARGETSVTLKLLGAPVSVLGEAEGETSVVYEAAGTHRRLLLDKGRVVGARVVGDWVALDEVRELVRRRARPSRRHLRRFARTGSLPVAGPRGWPQDAVVCHCLNVTCGALAACERGGALTVDALSRATGAGTRCGSCRPTLLAYVEPGRGFPAWLLAAGLVALALGAVAFTPLPDWLEALRSRGWSWVSGGAAVSFMLAGLFVARRRRGAWRELHAWLNVGAALTLVAHTRLRLGDNLTLALAGLTVLLLGSGALVALFPRLPKRWLAISHIALALPLPALVVLHMLTGLYFLGLP